MKIADTPIQPVVLSVPQAGAYLNVSSDTVRRLIRRGTLPHARIGNSIRIRRADLDGYLELPDLAAMAARRQSRRGLQGRLGQAT